MKLNSWHCKEIGVALSTLTGHPMVSFAGNITEDLPDGAHSGEIVFLGYQSDFPEQCDHPMWNIP